MNGLRDNHLQLLFVGLALLSGHAKAKTDNAVLPGTFGRYFVFPVPHCNTSVRPYLLIRAETEKQMVEVTLSGLFSEVIQTHIEDFSRFALPCRLLKERGSTRSGAVTLSTSRQVMAHVTYEGDNFLVYPVQALGSYYTLSEPQFHSKKSANTVLRVAITAAFKNTKIFVKDKIQELKNDKNIISSNIANLSLNENDVTVLEFTHTFRYLHIESSSYLFVLVWSTREKELDFIEQLAPDFTWGAEYIFPVPAWISDQIQVSITAGDIMEMRVIIRTKQRMKLYMIEGNGHLTMDVPADGFVHVSSSVNVQVLFLVWSKGEEYSKSSLIAGVALSQYRPITCQFKPTPQVFTTIAYLQYDLRSFKNVTDLFGNSSTVLNFTIIEGIRARRIKAPYLHEVVGVFSMFVRPHVLTDKLQLFTGANMHKHHPTSSSDRLNVTTMSKKATYFNDTSNETYTQIYSFNENSEIFEFIGCPETEVSGKTSWLRGRLKRNGVSASVIAVIISIVIAVFGVIGFIIGLMIIDMTGDQRHVRPIRIAPIVEDPSLQE